MKSIKWVGTIIAVIICMTILLVSCDNVTGGTDNSGNLDNHPNIPVLITYEVILDNLHNELINRVGTISSDDYTEPTGNEMGQIVNCHYVYSVISEYINKNLKPVPATPVLANMEHLLKRVDEANDNSTSYGTGIYATKQLIDAVAVAQALDLIILFQTQTWSISGEYAIKLPAGTYKVTMMSARGGTGQMWGKSFNISIGGSNGAEGETTISINTWTNITVVVGGHGGNGTRSFVGAGGWPGNGQNGTHNEQRVGAEILYTNYGGTGGASGIKNICHVPGSYYETNKVPQGTSISNNAIRGISGTKEPYVTITRM
jgi:hypothetical protein